MAYSKRTSAKMKNARAVDAAGGTYGAAVASELDELLGLDPGSTVKLILALRALLAKNTKALDEAELALVKEAGDDRAVLDARDASHGDLRASIGKARAIVLPFLGADQRRAFGLEAEIPETATELADYGRRTFAALIDAALPIQIAPGVVVTSDVLGQAVKVDEAKLTSALAKVDTEARELTTAIGARDLAIEPWTRVYRGVATILAGLFILAGREDLASRVRPTERRARGEEETEEPTPTPES